MYLTACFFLRVSVNATVKSVSGLLQQLDVIAKGSETVVMVPSENAWQRSPVTAYLDGISQTVLTAVSEGD